MVNRITRLICANVYFLGLYGSVVCLHRILGPPFCGFDRDPSLDRRLVLFHALQSLLLSLLFFAPCLFLYLFAPAKSTLAVMLVLGFCFLKIAIVNPWLARNYFASKGVDRHALDIPGLGAISKWLSAKLHATLGAEGRDGNTIYFRGPRPFVGFGSEINAWTLAVDTTATQESSLLPVGPPRRSVTDLDVEELYQAIEEKVQAVKVQGVATERVFFMEGHVSEEVQEVGGGKYARPAAHLPIDLLKRLNEKGEKGRQYLVLSILSATRDLMISQFIRFSQSGRFIFCEFAAHVVPPGKSKFYAFDRLFRYNPILYIFLGPFIFLGISLIATLLSPFVEALLWLGPSLAAINLTSWGIEGYADYVIKQISGGWFSYRVVGLILLFLLVFCFWRALLWLAAVAGIFLGLRTNFGTAISCRERWSTGARLEYFDLQETIRALQTQEKIITGALVSCLEAHGIDTGDLKQNISAFINQGVINSGEIRGDVSSKVAAIVFRKEKKTRKRRGLYAATSK